jgi:NAD(P)-dependent dehydrogenase (short-subunit alcohol dehydrogenase family)
MNAVLITGCSSGYGLETARYFHAHGWNVIATMRRCAVNVTSSATLTPMPLAAVYTASKMAIEGFTGSLAHELGAFNVRVKLVEPGYGPTTRFTSNVGSRMEGVFPEAYAAFTNPILASLAQVTTVTKESDVAEAVYRAANDVSGQLRFPAGADAVALAQAR